MTIYFIDEIGEIAVDLDGNGIQFISGKAWFSDGEKEYRIPLENLIEIIGG